MKKIFTSLACVRICCLKCFAAFKTTAVFVLSVYNCIYYEKCLVTSTQCFCSYRLLCDKSVYDLADFLGEQCLLKVP